MSFVQVGGRSVGQGSPCYVVAEAGVNHNGKTEQAHDLIDLAAHAGADAVKFQTFHVDRLVARGAPAAAYQAEATGFSRQDEMLAALMLPEGAWAELAHHAEDVGLAFLSTAFDLASAELVAGLGAPALKVPSGELTDLPFIRALASFGLPLIISTGMADIGEVAAAHEASREAPGVVMLHCVSAYPAPEEEANLRSLVTLRERFRVPVGWSDHTEGSLTAIAAVAVGANMLEKHVTLDRRMEGPDHSASADSEQFAEYVGLVRRTEAALGDGDKAPTPSELGNRDVVRRSWHSTRPLAAGTVLSDGDVVALRPGTGIPPSHPLHGMRLTRSIPAAHCLTFDDVEEVGRS